MVESHDSPFAVPNALQEDTEKRPSVLAKLLLIFFSLIAVPVAFFSTCFGAGILLFQLYWGHDGETLILIAVMVGLFAAVVVGIVMRRLYVWLFPPRNPHQPQIPTKQAFDK